MPIKVKFLRKWGINKEGTEKKISSSLSRELYNLNIIEFADKEGLENAFPNSKLLLKYKINPIKPNFTRNQVIDVLKEIEGKK